MLRNEFAALLLTLSLLYAVQAANVATSPATPLLATTSLHGSGNNAQACLTPTPADTSQGRLQDTGENDTVKGSVVPEVQSGKAQYLSKLNPTYTLHMQLVFKIRNADSFQNCLESISDPASSNYHHFLDLATLQPYLPTPGQKASVVERLTRSGFQVTEASSPLVINIVGPVETAESTFGVKLNTYRSQNTGFYAADSDPKLPRTYAAVVNGILGLDNRTTVKPRDQSVCSGPYCPQGLQVGYSFSGLYSGNHDGSGQKVAVVDVPGDPDTQTAINMFSALRSFRTVGVTAVYRVCAVIFSFLPHLFHLWITGWRLMPRKA
jgi:subtilase family serine protease